MHTDTNETRSHQVAPDATIDPILVGPGIQVHAFITVADQFDGRYPSDHLPVVADIEA